MLRLKRVYELPAASDGHRILVDRLWPRGLTREQAAISEWMKEIAPSTELRRWFAHDTEKWDEFQRRYKQELRAREKLVQKVADLVSKGRVTLVYSARDGEHNDAVVLADAVSSRLRRAKKTARPRRARRTGARPTRR